MRAEGNVAVRLHDILRAIAGIRETAAGLDYNAYLSVWSVKHSCERGIEIISEASRHIPDGLKESEPGVPWRQIAGVGNVLRHSYKTISDPVIWDIIVNHLRPLEAAAQRLLKEVEAPQDSTRPDA